MQMYFILCQQCLQTGILEFDTLFSFLFTLGHTQSTFSSWTHFHNLKHYMLAAGMIIINVSYNVNHKQRIDKQLAVFGVCFIPTAMFSEHCQKKQKNV